MRVALTLLWRQFFSEQRQAVSAMISGILGIFVVVPRFREADSLGIGVARNFDSRTLPSRSTFTVMGLYICGWHCNLS